MKKAIKRNAVYDLLKIGVYTRKDIAKQLGISVGSVSVHITHLRWQGHYINYDLDTRVMRAVSRTEYLAWLETKKKPSLTPNEAITRLELSLKRLHRTQAKWRIKARKHSLSADEAMEAKAQLTIHEIGIRRIETALFEAENQQFAHHINSTEGVETA